MKSNPFWKRISLFHYLIIKLVLFILVSVTTRLFGEPQQSEQVNAQLISEVQSTRPGQSFCVALQLKMNEHWHTYWKNPGDSGLPTKIKWSLPDGFIAGDIQWPYPKKFVTPTDVSYGYEGEILLITKISAPKNIKSGSNMKLSASVDWLACSDSCIPGHADLMIEMPIKNEKPKINSSWADHFRKTRKNLPKTISDWKINASVKKNQILIQIRPPLWFKSELTAITFYPEQVGIIKYSALQNLKRSGDGYIVEIQRSKLSTKLPAKLKGVLFSQKSWSNSGQEYALLIEVLLNVY